MALFDTNILVSAMNGNKAAIKAIGSFKDEVASISILNKYELLKGRKFVDASIINGYIANMKVYQLSDIAVEIASKIYVRLSNSGKMIDEFDILIAAVAITNDEKLVTFDRHFKNITEGEIIVLE
ncbi:MAG: type II toxin-antitoxin system VapC family toxin [Candidatus Micrarchaeota archaeon]|nr:type II toxin-antitoxin system VapC family toxin [Candidatus Micrarchaeota archaeon]MDE1864985.1 type II toxin-antitoxin system VapC family toxin [Candidatus Micrarchaeota archaeon]